MLKIAPKVGEIAGFTEETQTKDVALAGGASQMVHFDITTGPTGVYVISVGNLTVDIAVQGGREL